MRRDLGPRASSRGVKRGEGGKEDKIVKMKEMGSIWAKYNSREAEAGEAAWIFIQMRNENISI